MKKLLVITFLVMLAAALILGGCAKSSSTAPTVGTVPSPASPPSISVSSSGRGTTTTPPVAPAPAPAPAPPKVVYAQEANSADAYAADTERMIVRTGNINIVVDDVRTAIDQITKLANSFNGYVVSSNIWEQTTSPSPVIVYPGYKEITETSDWKRYAGSIAIRVPSESYENAMSALRGMAVQVTSENSNSKDVTEEYVDLKAKLQNLEATEAQLLKIMEKAEKVEDILNIQRELSNVRGNIEQTKGRMQYLERTSASSLIEVQLQQAKLDVSFTASRSVAKKGETISFMPQIAGGITPYSYEWDFGDGRTSTDRNPTHSYNKVGDYTVTLKLTDDRGNSDNQVRTDYITIVPGWSAGNVASGAWSGFVTFVQVLADILIWLGIFSPVWIIGGGIAYWIIRRKKTRK